jgi:sugar phosphate isomerase/epimerase
MPRVFRFIPLSEVRAEARRLSESGLQIGIDITRPDALFGSGWDREAREVGRLLRSLKLEPVVRGPGSDLPLGALDPTVVDQVRACHERSLAVAQLMGATRYILRRESLHGLGRVEVLARMEATSTVVGEVAAHGRARGISLLLQQHREADAMALEQTLTTAEASGTGCILAPARLQWAGLGPLAAWLERLPPAGGGLDLTDLRASDLEAQPLGRGLLVPSQELAQRLEDPRVGLIVVEGAADATADIVDALNVLGRLRAVGVGSAA